MLLASLWVSQLASQHHTNVPWMVVTEAWPMVNFHCDFDHCLWTFTAFDSTAIDNLTVCKGAAAKCLLSVESAAKGNRELSWAFSCSIDRPLPTAHKKCKHDFSGVNTLAVFLSPHAKPSEKATPITRWQAGKAGLASINKKTGWSSQTIQPTPSLFPCCGRIGTTDIADGQWSATLNDRWLSISEGSS